MTTKKSFFKRHVFKIIGIFDVVAIGTIVGLLIYGVYYEPRITIFLPVTGETYDVSLAESNSFSVNDTLTAVKRVNKNHMPPSTTFTFISQKKKQPPQPDERRTVKDSRDEFIEEMRAIVKKVTP